MSGRFRKGLVVGKFSPLHRGHEHLIRQAVSECDDVLVISYSKPEFPRCTRHEREQWLMIRLPGVQSVVIDDACLLARCRTIGIDPRRIPDNDAEDGEHRRFVAWLCLALLRTTVDAVFTSESYGDGFAGVLERAFGHPVTHRCVDPARVAFPVSGTQLRHSARLRRRYLPKAVASSYIQRVCVLGGESSGKTTLARAVGAALSEPVVEEFGRCSARRTHGWTKWRSAHTT